MIRILVADDHRIVREGLVSLLEKKGRHKVVASVSNGAHAIEKALSLDLDVAILDVTMPGLNGIEVAHRLRIEKPKLQIIILSMHAERQYVMEALRAGARGYVLKDSAFLELRKAIAMVTRGSIYLSPQVANLVVDTVARSPAHFETTPYDILSMREREVLQMLSEGRKTKEIADDLCVSPKTVETHRKRIMDKLDLHSIAELTKYAVRHGITDIQ